MIQSIFHADYWVSRLPYHSSDMEDVSQEYLSLLGNSLVVGDMYDSAGEVLMVSSVTALPIADGQVEDPAYWVKNLVAPVRFSSALAYSLKMNDTDSEAQKVGTILEIGPHAALKAYVLETLTELAIAQSIQYCATLNRNETDRSTILNTLGKLYCQGHPVNLKHINGSAPVSKKTQWDFPPYSFDHSKSYRSTSRTVEAVKFPPYKRHELLGIPVPDANSFEQRWRNNLRISEIPWLAMNNVCIPRRQSLLTF